MAGFYVLDRRGQLRKLLFFIGSTLLLLAVYLQGELSQGGSAPASSSDTAPASVLQINPSLARNALDRSIIKRLNSILQSCGELCNTDRPLQPGPFQDISSTNYFKVSSAPVQCRRLYTNKDLDAPREQAEAPQDIPSYLMSYYTLDGRIPVQPGYRNQKYLENTEKLQWTAELVDKFVSEAKERTLTGNYGLKNTNGLQDILSKIDINGMRVLVIGSENPWVEACALVAGAAHVTTLEYREIETYDPRMSAATPNAFAADFLSGRLEPFDVVVSFSSLEHSGLGRYGDALNPWGDIISVAKTWCVTKPGGYAIIEVPFRPTDEVTYFNMHRTYGQVRMPYMMTNWGEAFPSVSNTTQARVYKRYDAPIRV